MEYPKFHSGIFGRMESGPYNFATRFATQVYTDCKIFAEKSIVNERNLRIGSCLAWVYRLMDAHGKFGEHECSERVARGDIFLSALQTSQVHP